MTALIQPLDAKFPIVGPDGKPTIYFIKWAQQRQIDINDGLTLSDLIDYLTAHKLIEGTGIQLSNGGDINAGVTISADVQEILDGLSATRGTIIYRGLLGWTVLLPGTAGYVLATNGPGADPSWVAQSGGGGGGGSTPTIRAHNLASANYSTIAIPLPTGTIAGDIVVIHWESGYAISTYPAGWTPLWISNNGGTYTNQACAAKIMTAADITAGSVTVAAGGGYYGTYGAITIIGTTVAAAEKVDHYDSPGGANIPSAPVSGMFGVSTSDLIIGFASTRSVNTMGVSANLTILRSVSATEASGIIFQVAAAGLGKLGVSETITAPTANNGLAWTMVAFKGP